MMIMKLHHFYCIGTNETAPISYSLTLKSYQNKPVSWRELFVNDPIDIEYLRLKLIELEINIQKLPTEEDFLTTENMFNSQDVNFPVHMKSISTYKLNQNVTLTIGILSRQLNLPNGIISLEEAQEYNLYEGINSGNTDSLML